MRSGNLLHIAGQLSNDASGVTYQYKADLARILKRFKKAVVFDGSKGCIKAFAEGRIKTLLLHPGRFGART